MRGMQRQSGRRFTTSWNVKVLLSVLVTILVVALSVWTGLMVTSAHFGEEAYRDGRFETAERHYQTTMRSMPDGWEGWEPPFNRGTTRLRLGVDPDAVGIGPGDSSSGDAGDSDGDGSGDAGDSDGDAGDGVNVVDSETYHVISDAGMVDAGVADLELALTRVPEAKRENGQVVDPDNQPECKARRNLSIGQELQGDASVADGDSAAAVEKYALAQETLAPCQESEENQDQSERQEQKQQENEQSSGSDGSGGDGSGGGNGGSGGDGGGSGSGNSGGSSGGSGGSGGNEPNESSGGGLDPNMQEKEEQLRDRNRRGQGDYEDGQNQNYSGGVNW